MSDYIQTDILKCNKITFIDDKYKNSTYLIIDKVVNFSNTSSFENNKLYLSSSDYNTYKKYYIYEYKNNSFQEIQPTEGLIIYIKTGDKTYIYMDNNYLLLDFEDIDIENYNNGNFELKLNNKNNIKFTNTITSENDMTTNNKIVLNKYTRTFNNTYGSIDYFNFIDCKPFYAIGNKYKTTWPYWPIGSIGLGFTYNNDSRVTIYSDRCILFGFQLPDYYITVFTYIYIKFNINEYCSRICLYYYPITDTQTFNFKSDGYNEVSGRYTYSYYNSTTSGPTTRTAGNGFTFIRFSSGDTYNYLPHLCTTKGIDVGFNAGDMILIIDNLIIRNNSNDFVNLS